MTRLLLSIVALVLAVGMFAPKAEAAGERDRIRGVIVSVSPREGTFDLLMRGDRVVTVKVFDRTEITINGRRARLQDLRPRMRARAGGKWVRRGVFAARVVQARTTDDRR